MAKITKKAEILETLNKLITKEAELAQTNISGEPCKDTKVTSISESTETTDKNSVGPEKLNDEQGYKQEAAKDESEPLKGAKQAEDNSDAINKMASDILSAINTKLAAQAQTNISGSPLKDTKATSVSDETETTDKNGVGADKLNSEQGHEQKDSKDSSEPLKGAKKAEDQDVDTAVKVASYDLGRQLCEVLLQKTAEARKSQEKVAEVEMLKEAGRRDFDTLIAQAAAELETQQTSAVEQEKQAEVSGAAAFDELYKQAQIEALVEQVTALQAKVAEYEEKEKLVLAKEAAAKEEERFAKLAELVTKRIKDELSASAVPVAPATK